ncbi:VOC family protein [archaeon]|nr:VOC family protein [archaeon]
MNSVVWFEMPFDESERAQKFYKDVFGWNINSVPNMEDYLLANTTDTDPQTMQPKNPGAINGGMSKRNSNTAQHPVVVIQVDSIDEHAKKIESSGGKIVMSKTDIGAFGFYARVSDTEGNEIGIWEQAKQ